MPRSSQFAVVLVAFAALIGGAPASASPPGFATPTMVSPFIPGYEPDLAVDRSPKTAGQIYTSTPFGFSTTESFIFRSNDAGQSFHFTEGNELGKPATCIGGGDSELQIDPSNGNVFFSDLQGLTNFSNSLSTDSGRTWNTTCAAVVGAGVDRQWIGLDSSGGTTPVGAGATSGRAYEDYDNVSQNSDTNADNELGNQLVMNESVDGVNYGSNCQAAGAPCPGPPAVISRDEGIPGNVVVDNTTGPYRHRLYAVHTGSLNNSVILSWCSGKAGDATPAQVASDCTDPTQFALGDTDHVNVNWHDTVVRPPGSYFTGDLFASMALDQAGNVYVVWSEYPYGTDSSGNKVDNGPGAIKLAVSTDGGQHFGGATTVSPASLGNNVMPWVTAGSAGRIGIAWYGAAEAEEAGKFGPDTLDNGVWNTFYAQSVDATGATPTFTVVPVSDHPAKFGNISTQGFGGSPDRSLGDFMQVQTGLGGEAVVTYVDDTSADRNPDYCQGCGETASEAAGPIMVTRQDVGSGLFAGNAELTGGALPFGAVTDPTGKGYPDAFLSASGTDTNATPNLDVAAAKVSQPDASHVTVSMTTADAKLAQDLAVDPSLGGATGQWIVRWAAPQYAKPGDGNIFYVGMQAGPSGSPQFYTGTTCAIGTTHTKYFTYPPTTAVPGSISGATITWTVPLSAIGAPALGQSLFSVTGFTAVQTTPGAALGASGCSDPASGSGDPQIPSLIDASPPFTYTIGGRAAAPGGTPGSGQRPGGIGASSGVVCDTTRGFSSVAVRPRGRSLRIAFSRALKLPVTVDVFQVNRGSRVLDDRRVARFSGRSKSFTWSGRRVHGSRAPSDGFYFVRLAMRRGGRVIDARRIAFVRRHGRFAARPAFYRFAACGEITSFRLVRPVFGHNRALGISYALRDDATVSVTVLRGKRVVRRWRAVRRLQHRTYRLRVPAGRLAHGDYRVVLQAAEPGSRATARLTARRV
ncbi:MAG: hypothetical protein JWM71_332 [Solirubrobacteraceae bacterium]|nr:hypothetical protein [Solirubrobacteraceae bacterium]